MSDKTELEKALSEYKKAVEEKHRQVNEAAEQIETTRQTQTEQPYR